MYSTFKTKYGSPFSIKARRKDEEKKIQACSYTIRDLKLAC